MKHSSMLILALYLLAGTSCPGPGPSGPPPSSNLGVCQAQLFFADIATYGKVVPNGNSLIFIDENPVAGSSDTFSIDRSNLSYVNKQPNTVSVYTNYMIRYRARQEKHITFNFGPGNCNPILRWLDGGWFPSGGWEVEGGGGGGRGGQSCHPPLDRLAKHRRFLHSDPRGELIIRGNRIWFGIRGRTQYQWNYRDVKDIKQDGPFVLRVTPVEGGQFTFDILDRPISSTEFNLIKFCVLR